MNIFIIEHRNNDTIEQWCDRIAKSYADQHVNKIITEIRQMVQAIAVNDLEKDIGQTVAHLNHPVTRWMAASRSNWYFAIQLAYLLDKEAKRRYSRVKEHGAITTMTPWIRFGDDLPDNGLTPFAIATPKRYKALEAVKAYQTYYCDCKSWYAAFCKVTGKYIAKPFTFTNQDEPSWYKRVSVRRAFLSGALTDKKGKRIEDKNMILNYLD